MMLGEGPPFNFFPLNFMKCALMKMLIHNTGNMLTSHKLMKVMSKKTSSR